MIAYLKLLQQSTSRRPSSPASWNERDIRSVYPDITDDDVAELAKFMAELNSSLRPPTEYEGPHHLKVQVRAAQLDEVVTTHGPWQDFAEPPLFALWDAGRINAQTSRAPTTGEPIVFIDEELLHFLSLFSCVVALAAPVGRPVSNGILLSTDMAEVRAKLKRDESMKIILYAVLLGCVMTGRTPREKLSAPDQYTSMLTGKLVSAAETFVLAHEYAHVLEKHLDDGMSDITGTDGQRVSQSLWSLAQEGIADRVGLFLAAWTLGDQLTTYWGAELFLCANEALLKAIAMVRSGRENGLREDERHQLATLRFRRDALEWSVRDRLEKASNGKAGSEGEWARVGAQMHFARDIIQELWQHTAPLLRDAHERGARPDPMWEL